MQNEIKVAVFLCNGSEDIETIVPVDVLRRLELKVDLISIESLSNITLAQGTHITADKTLSETSLEDYAAFITPGGAILPSFESEKTEKLRAFYAEHINDENLLFANICAAPHVLHYWGLLEGRKVTSYPGVEKDAFEDVHTGAKVEIDRNLITANGPGSSFEFARAIANKLVGNAKTDATFSSMQYTS
jgi:4-methyl-5(b-hydroxyethyl)-thiazole monophosphate biosynthesis